MVNPIAKLHLDTKLGPLSRKHWLFIGLGVGGGFLYWRHTQKMNNVAGPTDPTIAGAVIDQSGNQVTDAGTSPMSAFDPYTSGYSGYGYDLALGMGGIVGPSGGNANTGAGNVPLPMPPPSNPAAPGSAYSGPSAVTINLPGATDNRRHRTAKHKSKEERETHHRKVRQGAHNMKNGRNHHNRHRQHYHQPTTNTGN